MWRNSYDTRNELLPYLREGARFVAFDTETTGLDESAKIIQFSALKYRVTDNGFKQESWVDTYINPEEPLTPKITEITGITDLMLVNQPTESTVGQKILTYLTDADFLLAYNASFDLRMIEQMQQRLGTRVRIPKTFDALKMARDVVPADEVDNHKLSTIVGYMFPEEEFTFHSAIEDTRAMAMCFAKFVKFYRELEKEPPKRRVHLEWAAYSVNPNRKSQTRIKVCLSRDKEGYGDIFFDCLKKQWSHKATKSAKMLFDSIDLFDLERQVLKKYAWRYNAQNMDELAANWAKEKRRKDREAS